MLAQLVREGQCWLGADDAGSAGLNILCLVHHICGDAAIVICVGSMEICYGYRLRMQAERCENQHNKKIDHIKKSRFGADDAGLVLTMLVLLVWCP
jgi:hypothetical protein